MGCRWEGSNRCITGPWGFAWAVPAWGELWCVCVCVDKFDASLHLTMETIHTHLHMHAHFLSTLVCSNGRYLDNWSGG